MRLIRALCAMIALAAAACRTGQSHPPATAAAPATGAPLAQHQFHFGDADLSGSVEASGPPRYTMRDRVAMIEIPVGAMGRILCAVYDRILDVGGALSGLGDLLEGEADLDALEIISVTAAQETPLLTVRALFRHRAARDRVDVIQLAIRPHPTTSVLCMRERADELPAFQRIVSGFVASLGRAVDPEPVRMVQIDVASGAGAQPTGFTWRRVTARAAGGYVDQEVSTFILNRPQPTTPAHAIVTLDFVTIQVSDLQGRLVGVGLSKGRNGQLFDRVEAHREGNELVFERELDGRSFSGRVTAAAPDGFPSNVLVGQMIRDRLLRGGEQSFDLEEYHPMFDPAAAMRVLYRHAAGSRTIELTYGDRPLSIVVDGDGIVERLEGGTGADVHRSTRLLRRGTP